MKKLIVFLIICALTIGLCACNNTGDYVLSNQFIVIKKQNESFFSSTNYFLYDKDTKVVYLYTIGEGHGYATMCPYYIIKNKVPTIAIYGINYNG